MTALVLQLLSKPKFSGVEKIKTIGSTYMAATGLSATPNQEQCQVQENVFLRNKKHIQMKTKILFIKLQVMYNNVA